MTELALMRVDALTSVPDFAAALGQATDAIRAGRDATLPLMRARRALDGAPEATRDFRSGRVADERLRILYGRYDSGDWDSARVFQRIWWIRWRATRPSRLRLQARSCR
jgi:hypothetical protein